MIMERFLCVLFLLCSSLPHSLQQPSNNLCNHVAPGLDRIAQGVDITRLDLFHDYGAGDDDGFTNRIIDFNCVDGKTWTSPFDGVVYEIPDEIDELVSMSSGVLIGDSVLMKHSSELKESMSIDAGIDFAGVIGAFSASGSYKTSHTKIMQSEKTIATNKAVVNIAQATFAPAEFIGNSSMSKYMRAAINKLPGRFDSNSSGEYMKFFASYGTHFFHRGNFGGSLSKWFEMDNALFKEMDEKSVSVQVKASFLSTLKAHGAYSGDVSSTDERFTKHETSSEKYYGGQANLFDTEGYKTWWPTIARNPWLHSGSLLPITDLVTDVVKREELVKAYQAYLAKAYLTELRDMYDAYSKNIFFNGSNLLLTSVIELSNFIAGSTVPDNSTVLLYQNRLREYINTPQWFLDSSTAFQFGQLEEETYKIGDIPAYRRPGQNRRPCNRVSEGVQQCEDGRIYFKTSPEGQQILDRYGAHFSLTHSGARQTGEAWRWWVENYVAGYNLNFGTDPPGWLRGAKLSIRHDHDAYPNTGHDDDYVEFPLAYAHTGPQAADVALMVADDPDHEKNKALSYSMLPSSFFVDF